MKLHFAALVVLASLPAVGHSKKHHEVILHWDAPAECTTATEPCSYVVYRRDGECPIGYITEDVTKTCKKLTDKPVSKAAYADEHVKSHAKLAYFVETEQVVEGKTKDSKPSCTSVTVP